MLRLPLASTIVATVAAVVMLAAPSAAFRAEDQHLQVQEVRQTTVRDFSLGYFDRLSARLDFMRERQLRTHTGEWRLGFAYDALAWYVSPEFPQSQREKAAALTRTWVEAMPESAPAVVARGVTLLGAALAETGEKRMALLERTAEFLEAHKVVGANDPHWHVVRQQVASHQGLGTEPLLLLAEQAIRLHPTYYPIAYAALERFVSKDGVDRMAVERLIEITAEHSAAIEGHGVYARL